ncbi:class I SAM-dependent methyltransferase [Nocardioides guangzhouensis]|uniref:Class I SAM-dependent methyltransferase n=1 Tax=Nocardioides guangzhouensis TaxID=2497878 RepID=A0A4Q4ZLG7_9ACTN|nr:class I SAM-dependent methyltransferase [Nocardioides guangzhouensis]RYP88294.1 class I SAM-dependent methyltransferase [Nocardioides guangzhouensis]
MTLQDSAAVRAQYATEESLHTRLSVWHPALDGRDPSTLALDAAVGAVAGRETPHLLDVGCGTGGFAARLSLALPRATVSAIDQSERFVRLTRERGIDARVGDAQALPFDDGSLDVVTAMWMLYHVPDLDLALAEARRVLRPGGLFVAVTNGDQHTADLRREAGGAPLVTQFSSENGEEALRRHFSDVRREDVATRALFPDHAAAQAYLDTLAWVPSEELAAGDAGDAAAMAPAASPDLSVVVPPPGERRTTDLLLPAFDGPREYAGHVTVFTCH